jgi:hypothetical protein
MWFRGSKRTKILFFFERRSIMCKRLIILGCLVVVLGLANSATAALWTGSGDGTSWDDPSNWSPVGIPGTTEQVDMNAPERGPIVDVDVECGLIYGPMWNVDSNMVVDVIEGNMRVNGTWRFAQGGDGIGTINVSGGNVSIGGDFRWSDSADAYGIVNISGGTVTCPRIKIGDEGGGEINVTGSGVLICTGGSDFSGTAPTFITVDGGTYTTLGQMNGGADISYKVYSGILECGEYNGGSPMDIEEGQFIVDGDATVVLNAEVGLGNITAYGNTSGTNGSTVHVNYDSEEDKTIVTATTIYYWARNPGPETGAENQCADSVTLSWTAGVDATQHDIYLGTDETAVENATTATSGIFKLRQSGTTYAPSGLLPGVTYYWRIDEFDGSSIEPAKYIWSFSTNDGSAYDPDPAHNATLVDIEADLSWTAGCGALSHNVYFGTDFNDVNDGIGGTSQGPQPGTTFEPGTLDISTNYYWRIDEVGSSETVKGKVWKFRSRSAIINPNMVLWYKFDEDTGSSPADSSGYERHGSVVGTTEAEWEPNEGRFGGALRFTTSESLAVPVDTLGTVSSALSIAVWVNDQPGSQDQVIVFDAGDSGLDGEIKLTGMVPNTSGAVSFRAGNADDDIVTWNGAPISSIQGEWHHFAFVKDEVADSISIYFDAKKIATKSAVAATLSDLGNKPFNIGAANNSNNSPHEAAFDDFRVFDIALSDSEIAGLFRGGDVDTAWSPDPYDGQQDVDRESMLKWRPGDSAAFHDVYFGTNFDDVNDATTAVGLGVYQDRVSPNEFDPGKLDFGQKYYWRIDEVNDPCVWKGNVWSFTAANFIIIDDFESYDDIDKFIYFTWIEDDASVYQDLGIEGSEPVYSGSQSLWFEYNNSIYAPNKYYSEISKDLGGMDFTQDGVKVLTVFFYGDPANTAGVTEEPYIGLDDGTNYQESRYTDTGNAITDIQETEWHEWNIAVTDFNTVTTSSVETIFIGFGQRGNTVPGGGGEVFFDDLRLYPPKCVPSLGPDYDFSGDCRVDLVDVGMMADKWLRRDAQLSVQAPSTGPVGYWELDDTGAVAFDSAGSNDGAMEGDYSWVDGKVGTGAVEFTDNGGRVRVPYAAALMPSAAVSATMWIYPTRDPGYSARVLAKGIDAGDWEAYYMQFSGDVSWTVRDDPNHSNHVVDAGGVGLNEWIHIAGTYDSNELKLYINAQLEDDDTIGDIGGILQDTNDLAIGNAVDINDRAFFGKVDDVRIYNYALTAEEIAYVASAPTHDGYMALDIPENIYDDEPAGQKAINLRDFAELMTAWLDQQLWPAE